MVLSLYQILEKLNIPYKVAMIDDENARCITGASCLKSGEMPVSEDILYLSCDSLTPPKTGKKYHFIFTGREDISDFSSFHSVTFVDSNVNIQDLLSEILDIIIQFNEWAQNIERGILKGASLEDTLQSCSLFLNNPIGIFDFQGNLMMRAGTIPESVEYDPWDYVIAHGHAPVENNTQLDLWSPKEKLPYYYRTENEYSKSERLLANIYLKDQIFGHIGMTDIVAPFTPGEYANVCYVQDFMNLAFANSGELALADGKTPWFLQQLVNGENVSPDVASYNFEKYNLSLNQHYLLWNFAHSGKDPKATRADALSIISYMLQTNLIFHCNGQILAIDIHTEHADESFLSSLGSILVENQLNASLSMEFSDLMELHHAFMQTAIAMEFAWDNKVVKFTDCFQAYIQQSLTSQQYQDGVYFPNLEKLYSHHSGYGAELIRCLQTYILCDFNVSATAKKLFIHRHTMLYRLEIIKNILQIDFSSLSDDERILLYLSCQKFKS